MPLRRACRSLRPEPLLRRHTPNAALDRPASDSRILVQRDHARQAGDAPRVGDVCTGSGSAPTRQRPRGLTAPVILLDRHRVRTDQQRWLGSGSCRAGPAAQRAGQGRFACGRGRPCGGRRPTGTPRWRRGQMESSAVAPPAHASNSRRALIPLASVPANSRLLPAIPEAARTRARRGARRREIPAAVQRPRHPALNRILGTGGIGTD